MIGWLIGSSATLLLYIFLVGFTYTHPYQPQSPANQILAYLETSSIHSTTTSQGQLTTISFQISESNWPAVSSQLKPLLNSQNISSISQTLFSQSRAIVVTLEDN